MRRAWLVMWVVFVACAEPQPEPWDRLLPLPREVLPAGGARTFDSFSSVGVSDEALLSTGRLLASELRRGTGWAWPVSTASSAVLRLELDASLGSELGDEGYELSSSRSGLRIRGSTPAGVFYGTQTLRLLLPVELGEGTLRVGTGVVRDVPRFAWRGLMVDLARHFFGLADLKRLVEVMSRYKLNRLHLHLTDDQGWRLESLRRPALNAIGSQTQVGGGAGGFLTHAEYAELVAFAAERFITVVPEIDLPGHTNAALSSIAELNCDGQRTAPYTGTMVGFSSLCATSPETERFIDDVIGEVAELTPGRWIHVGGDEARNTSTADYVAMTSMARRTVEASGKQVIGWEELARADAGTGTVVQHWLDAQLATQAAKNGAHVILSPARTVYFDMQYAEDTPRDVGTFWAGFVSAQQSYAWKPLERLPDVDASQVLGVEGAMWTEFVATREQLDQMIFPRLLGVAELGWSSQAPVEWRDYSARLASQGPRLARDGVNFFRAPQVEWPQ